MKHIIKIGGLIILALALSACGKSLEKQIAEQLELGMKYLSEFEYEQAVVAFQKVIELDEKNMEAYLGLGQAHSGQAEQTSSTDAKQAIAYYEQAVLDYGAVRDFGAAEELWKSLLVECYIKQGQIYELLAEENEEDGDSCYLLAQEMYEMAQEIDPSDQESCWKLIDIYKRLGELEKLQKLLEENQDVSEEIKTQWEELHACMTLIEKFSVLCENGDFSHIYELMQGEEYQRLREFSQMLGNPAFVIKEEKGLGLYPVETREYGNCMIYYGDYQEGKRHGNGVWMGYHDGNNYRAIGTWSGDKPNGQQEVREWSGSLAETVSTRVVTGNVADGYWDGSVIWRFERKSGEVQSYPVTFTNGKWDIIRIEEKDDGVSYIVSEKINEKGTTMSTKTPDALEGIEGFH